MGPVPANHDMIKFTDLLLPNRLDWNREQLQHILLFEEDKILLIKPSRSGAPDKKIWLKKKMENIRQNQDIRLLASSYTLALLNLCSSIPNKGMWKLKTDLKIKLFFWKLGQNTLHVGECLAAKNIPIVEKCPRCKNLESINQIFFHCEFTRKVWALVPFSTHFDARG